MVLLSLSHPCMLVLIEGQFCLFLLWAFFHVSVIQKWVDLKKLNYMWSQFKHNLELVSYLSLFQRISRKLLKDMPLSKTMSVFPGRTTDRKTPIKWAALSGVILNVNCCFFGWATCTPCWWVHLPHCCHPLSMLEASFFGLPVWIEDQRFFRNPLGH